jgi:hypothetical protein
MLHRDRLIKTSRIVVRIASVANRLLLLGIVLLLLWSFVFSGVFAEWIAQSSPADLRSAGLRSMMIGTRLVMLLGIAMTVAADRLLAALAQIIASTGAGDPFILANARRLQTIGWSLLALQLLDLPAALINRFFPSIGSAGPNPTFSVGGWIAVLMVFVLSRIFAAGSAMRDDLEGTV